nr:unnamed protein product [Digitaria exilis]
MSSPAVGTAPPVFDGGAPPFGRQQQQPDYSFSGRVLLTAVVILAILTVIFILIRLILYQFVARARGGGGGGLTAGVRRTFGSFGRSARHGLDAAALASLPVTAYRRKLQADDASTSEAAAAAADCAVCLSELADGEKVRALPSCGHVFHVDCVDAWLRTRVTCPVCRAEVRPNKQVAGNARPSAPAPAAPVFRERGTLVVTLEGGAAETTTSRGARAAVSSGAAAIS